MNINDFISNLSGGGAKPNLFRVIVPFPNFSIVGGETNQLVFLARTASLPASTLGQIDVSYRGRVIKLAGDRTFDDWAITVLNDTDFKIRNAFERWSNGINTHTAATGLTQPSQYAVDVVVEQLDRNEKTIKSYTLKGAWVSDISAIDLNAASTNELEEFGVTFKYQYWTATTTS